MQKDELTILILCGGKSSRMGQDKALLEFQGIPLLRKIALLGLECTDQVGLITPSPPTTYLSIAPRGCYFITEETPTQGPLLAFAQGLASVTREWVLLLACDLPLLQADIVKSWSNSLAHLPDTVLALVPHHDGHWHPLCGFYRSRCLGILRGFIDQGGTSFQAWLDTAWVQVLPVENPDVLFNCNTPEDWQILTG